MMYYGYMTTGGWVMMGAGILIFLLIIGLIISWLSSSPDDDKGKPVLTAHETLDRRLASGELGVEEYEQLLAKIEGGEKGP